MDAYAVLGVPEEPWIDASVALSINVLQSDRSVESSTSPAFPNVTIAVGIPTVIQRAMEIGTSLVLLEFEDWLDR